MDLRQLKYFLAVAETLHFTRAAEHLGIAQPPLSQQIRKLEDEVGAQLFHRLSRGVELTEAGKRLQEDARHVIESADQAMINAQRAARGITGRIRLGFASSSVFHSNIALALRVFRSRYPSVELSPHESDSPSLVEAVCESRLDAAFVRLPSLRDDLRYDIVAREPLRWVLPAEHPLAGAESVSPVDVMQDPLIMSPSWTSPALYETLLNVYRESGIEPQLAQEAPQVSSCPYLVASGFGISLIPQSVCHVRHEGVSYPALNPHSPLIDIVLVTRRFEHSPTIRNMANVVHHEFHEQFKEAERTA